MAKDKTARVLDEQQRQMLRHAYVTLVEAEKEKVAAEAIALGAQKTHAVAQQNYDNLIALFDIDGKRVDFDSGAVTDAE